ncbi:MAG: UDP-N-acetylmuramate--L-alanine ligase [Clostridiaceae bacterium]|nr:UDP-N-acetylmuramate--L-alanine ligase [Clostridiaceae bacterium]
MQLNTEQLKDLIFKPNNKIYFVGIGGISMCGLAELAQHHGMQVAGSDLHSNNRTAYLESLGIAINYQQTADNIERFQPDAIVYTLAVPVENPERIKARELGIAEIERAVYLGLLNRNFKYSINIAGTNGKTTTTAMCALILLEQGLDPTVHLGAELKQFKTTVRPGSNNHLMVSEACEFGRSFLHFYSTTAAVLNIDHDHVDIFPTIEDVIYAFAEFVALLDPSSNLVVPAFDPLIPKMLEQAYVLNPAIRNQLKIFSFGYPEDRFAGQKPDLCCDKLDFVEGYPHFRLSLSGEYFGNFNLKIPGKFNVDNAMAAIACAYLNGAEAEAAREALAEFTGAEGRFTETGYYNGARIIADYAHHPNSITETLQAAENIPHNKLYTVFQPITYSRAKGLADGFVEALAKAKNPILMEVYDDREKDHSFSSAIIADRIKEKGVNALFFDSLSELEKYLRKVLDEGDLAIIMGQDVRTIADNLTGRTDHFK